MDRVDFVDGVDEVDRVDWAFPGAGSLGVVPRDPGEQISCAQGVLSGRISGLSRLLSRMTCLGHYSLMFGHGLGRPCHFDGLDRPSH